MSDSEKWGPRTDSGPRAPLLDPEELDEEQSLLYRSIVQGPRASSQRTIPLTDDYGRLLGPFGIALFAPRIGSAVQEVGAALRYRGELSDRIRELCILAVAAHHDSVFEWWAHETAARKLGISDSQLDAVREGTLPAGLSDTETTAVGTVLSLMRTRHATDDEYHQAVAALGRSGTAELVWLVAYYEGLALALRVFDLPNPAHEGDRT